METGDLATPIMIGGDFTGVGDKCHQNLAFAQLGRQYESLVHFHC